MRDPVYSMGNLRIVDLTKVLDPKTESRRCSLDRFNTGGPIPDFHTHMDITSHLGTHVECPYHHHDDWPDVAALPLTAFMGRGIYVMLDLPKNAQITGADLEAACGSKIKEGDAVILDSPYKIPPFTSETNGPNDHRLVIGKDSAEWFAAKKVKCVGFGFGVSIEDCKENVAPFHDILMADNVLFLEVLENVEKLQKGVFFISYTPLPIVGLDSSPVRVYAIEGLAEFS